MFLRAPALVSPFAHGWPHAAAINRAGPRHGGWVEDEGSALRAGPPFAARRQAQGPANSTNNKLDEQHGGAGMLLRHASDSNWSLPDRFEAHRVPTTSRRG